LEVLNDDDNKVLSSYRSFCGSEDAYYEGSSHQENEDDGPIPVISLSNLKLEQPPSPQKSPQPDKSPKKAQQLQEEIASLQLQIDLMATATKSTIEPGVYVKPSTLVIQRDRQKVEDNDLVEIVEEVIVDDMDEVVEGESGWEKEEKVRVDGAKVNEVVKGDDDEFAGTVIDKFLGEIKEEPKLNCENEKKETLACDDPDASQNSGEVSEQEDVNDEDEENVLDILDDDESVIETVDDGTGPATNEYESGLTVEDGTLGSPVVEANEVRENQRQEMHADNVELEIGAKLIDGEQGMKSMISAPYDELGSDEVQIVQEEESASKELVADGNTTKIIDQTSTETAPPLAVPCNIRAAARTGIDCSHLNDVHGLGLSKVKYLNESGYNLESSAELTGISSDKEVVEEGNTENEMIGVGSHTSDQKMIKDSKAVVATVDATQQNDSVFVQQHLDVPMEDTEGDTVAANSTKPLRDSTLSREVKLLPVIREQGPSAGALKSSDLNLSSGSLAFDKTNCMSCSSLGRIDLEKSSTLEAYGMCSRSSGMHGSGMGSSKFNASTDTFFVLGDSDNEAEEKPKRTKKKRPKKTQREAAEYPVEEEGDEDNSASDNDSVDNPDPKERFFGLLNLDPWDLDTELDDDAIQDIIFEHPSCCRMKYAFEGFNGSVYPISVLCALGASVATIKKCYKAFPDAFDDADDWVGTPLHYACSYRASMEVAEYIVKMDLHMLKQTNRFNRVPLHMYVVLSTYTPVTVQQFSLFSINLQGLYVWSRRTDNFLPSEEVPWWREEE
jgi:hypothetical protein